MKVRISKNTLWMKYFLGAASITALFFFFRLLMTDFLIQHFNTRILLGISIACITSFYFAKKAKTVRYDRKNIYISCNNKEKCIPLNQIKRVRFTLLKLNNHPSWLIDYYNDNNELSHVRFIPNLKELEYFRLLKEDLIKLNSKTIILEEAKSFF